MVTVVIVMLIWIFCCSAKGRPHYYSTKREEYAHVTFDLDAGTLLPSALSRVRMN